MSLSAQHRLCRGAAGEPQQQETKVNIYALATGAVIAVVVVLLFKAWRLEQANWAYPALLATFPVNYWAFAIYAADSTALLKEFLVGLAFLAVAYTAYKIKSFVTLLLLAAGYVLHAAYDFLHNSFFVNAGAPTWWPEFCGSVDVLIGAYIAYLALTRQPPNSPRRPRP
jgi:lysylphosphatidylglycerol synthetase-like protein (DUF2156 family)